MSFAPCVAVAQCLAPLRRRVPNRATHCRRCQQSRPDARKAVCYRTTQGDRQSSCGSPARMAMRACCPARPKQSIGGTHRCTHVGDRRGGETETTGPTMRQVKVVDPRPPLQRSAFSGGWVIGDGQVVIVHLAEVSGCVSILGRQVVRNSYQLTIRETKKSLSSCIGKVGQ